MEFNMYTDKEQFETYYKAIEYKSLLQEVLKTINNYLDTDHDIAADSLARDLKDLIVSGNIDDNLNL